MTPEDKKKLRELIERKIVLHKKAIHGDYGEDKEFESATHLLHEAHMVDRQIDMLLTPETLLELLDVNDAYEAIKQASPVSNIHDEVLMDAEQARKQVQSDTAKFKQSYMSQEAIDAVRRIAAKNDPQPKLTPAQRDTVIRTVLAAVRDGPIRSVALEEVIIGAVSALVGEEK